MLIDQEKKSTMRSVPAPGPSAPSPLRWWRSTMPDAFDAAALRDMKTMIGKVSMIGEAKWRAATSQDAPAAIAVALGMDMEHDGDRTDLAMTALTICAAEGDVTACMVLSNIIRRIRGAGGVETRVASGWLDRCLDPTIGSIVADKRATNGDRPLVVQIMSDLHVDYPGSRGFPSLAPGAGLVLIAGDTCQGLSKSIELQRDAYPGTEIATVAGNHEFYGGKSLRDDLDAGMRRAEQLGVHLLENGTAVFGPLRVIAATGWTDYELFGHALREPAMRLAAEVMHDHKKIKWQRDPWKRFRPVEARMLHLKSRAYIDAVLAEPHAGPSLVMMHHGASMEAVAPSKQRGLTAAAYASDLLPIVDRHQPQFVLTGHTHHSMDLKRGRSRMMSNPSGYADENRQFNPQFTIEVTHD